MPYGSKGSTSNASVTMLHKSPGNTQVIVPTQVFHGLNRNPYWSRLGTNANLKNAGVCKRYTGPMKLISIELPLGTKLPYKVINKKTGKPVWARRPIKVWKLVPDKSIVKSSRGLDLPPNNLAFFTKFVQPIATPSISGRYDDDWNEEYSGDVWMGFTPANGSQPIPMGPDDADHMRSQVTSLEGSANKKALSKLYAKAKNQNVNLLNAIGERRQTVKLLFDLSSRLIKALIAMKKFNFFEMVRALLPDAPLVHKSVASEFLMIQYGLRPLISDINGLVDHLNNWEPLQFDMKVSATEKITFEETAIHRNGIAVDVRNETSGKCTVSYKVRVRTRDNFGRNLARLGLTNINSTAYELIPFSFILDWLIPVGNYLNEVDAFDGLEIVHCAKTVYLKENVIFDRNFGGRDNYGYTWATAKSTVVVQKVSVNRTLLTAIPDLPFPSVKDPFSREHFYNFLALLTVLRKS